MVDAIMSNAAGNARLQRDFTSAVRYLALHIADPTELGDASTEVLGGGYLRQRILFGAPSNKSVVNTNNIVFPSMPGSIVAFFALWSAQHGGTMQDYYPVGSIVVPGGQQFLLAVGDVAWSF